MTGRLKPGPAGPFGSMAQMAGQKTSAFAQKWDNIIMTLSITSIPAIEELEAHRVG